MIHSELLQLLRCPHCAPLHCEGFLDLLKDSWLICQECDRKYPIRDGIPIMLVEEGERWIETDRELLAVPPPK